MAHRLARKQDTASLPVALAAEILAERWMQLVVRELLCGSVRFNDLQRGMPRMSSALLTSGSELQFVGIVGGRRGGSGASSIT